MVKLTVGDAVRDYSTDSYTNVSKRGQDSFIVGSKAYSLGWYTNSSFYNATIFTLDTEEPKSAFFGRAVAIPGATSGFIADATIVGPVDGMKMPRFLFDWVSNHAPGDDLAAHMFQGNDVLQGGRHAAVLDGYAGKDQIIGGAEGDTIIGGAGRDTLTGGGGADRFVYTGAQDVPAGPAETIKDFSHAEGDVIDLSRFDADATMDGVQGLTFIGNAAFHAGGSDFEVRVAVRGATVNLLQFDLDHDGVADAAISVHTSTMLTAADLGLEGAGARAANASAFGEDARAVAVVPHLASSLDDVPLTHLV